RATIGPNALRHIEQTLAALDGLDLAPDRVWSVVSAIQDFTFGNVARKARERDKEPHTLDAELAEAHVREFIANGEYPRLASLVGRKIETASDFDEGLSWLLDGIERAARQR